jgi:D-alanyl-lipoteichoic acid acyltransferase DltB (MBOAT superfamily)
MSYVIDIYRKKMEATKNYLDYALFVTYFPHLVAGPIMRAKDLLPQISSPRQLSLDKFYEGCYLTCWGLFQKIFVADNLAKIVDPVFSSSGPYNGIQVLIALYAFAFQIYCDFAGYSNIARGLGKCMGFDIMINFNLPYFATNPSDFWKRWHISLSSWLRDYLYIPLGGNRKGTFFTYRNLAITMLLGGLWHGAAWTFVLWGTYHGLLLIIYRLITPALEKIPPKNFLAAKIWFVIRVVFFFHLVCFGWLLFRAQNMTQLFTMLHGLIFNFDLTHNIGLIRFSAFKIAFFLWVLIIVQLYQYIKNDLTVIAKSNIFTRIAFYYTSVLLMISCGVTTARQFIYFQF